LLRHVRRFLMVIPIIMVGLWLWGPREPASLAIDRDRIAIPAEIDAYLLQQEGRHADLIEGVEKRIIWAREPQTRTPLSIVYIHGFSASSEEIRPVPDRLATALGANLHFARLTGHGRGTAAMGDGTVTAWMQDVGEALEIGRSIGERVIVIATSTGGTLAAAAALDPVNMANISGIIFVSPNFGINNRAAALLTWPLSRHWVPWILGDTRDNEPRNARHAQFWTTRYPTVALMPMAAIVKAVADADFSGVSVPALFYYSADDQVVDPERTVAFARGWGGPVTLAEIVLQDGDDQFSHVIAGDIVSPQQTEPAVQAMLAWIRGL